MTRPVVCRCKAGNTLPTAKQSTKMGWRVQPIIVITRPAAQAAVFASALKAANGSALQILVAPLMRIEPLTPQQLGDPSHVIFTSVNGVDQAQRLDVPTSAIAWCVGDQTAEAAAQLGFQVRNAQGNSADLVRLIIAASPVGEIVHLRGAHATGRIVEQLCDAGLNCSERVVYAQVDTEPPIALREVLEGITPLLIPVFSARSARLLAQLLPCNAPITVVAISWAVANAAPVLRNIDIVVAETPDKDGMISATLQAHATLSLRKTT